MNRVLRCAFWSSSFCRPLTSRHTANLLVAVGVLACVLWIVDEHDDACGICHRRLMQVPMVSVQVIAELAR